jgi:hypothetical protein
MSVSLDAWIARRLRDQSVRFKAMREGRSRGKRRTPARAVGEIRKIWCLLIGKDSKDVHFRVGIYLCLGAAIPRRYGHVMRRKDKTRDRSRAVQSRAAMCCQRWCWGSRPWHSWVRVHNLFERF